MGAGVRLHDRPGPFSPQGVSANSKALDFLRSPQSLTCWKASSLYLLLCWLSLARGSYCVSTCSEVSQQMPKSFEIKIVSLSQIKRFNN